MIYFDLRWKIDEVLEKHLSKKMSGKDLEVYDLCAVECMSSVT